MYRVIAAAIAVWTLLAAAAAGSERVVVVELYTSQGCSSCPPADALLGELTRRDGVIPLGLHVDYWDYIGWRDDFADPAHTDRQRAYARAKGKKMIYTPQMVVQGETHIVGAKPMELADAIVRHASGAAPVAVELERAGDRVVLTARASGDLGGDAVVDVVTYLPEATRSIERGENAGRTLTYHNIVTGWQTIGTWSGDAPFRATLQVPDGTPLVVIVQREGQSAVLGASRLR